MRNRRSATKLAVAVVFVVATAPALAVTILDTTGSWDGSSYISTFGPPNTQTYGQVVTVPAGETSLTSFGFRIRDAVAGQSVVFRGEVYAWDAANHRATGSALYESGTMTTAGSTAFQSFTFTIPGGVPVVAGTRYVLFCSSSKDVQTAAQAWWGMINVGSTYPGGDFVFINNGTDVARWTTGTWDVYGGGDLAFTAIFGDLTTVVPTLSGWALGLMAAALAAGATLKLRA